METMAKGCAIIKTHDSKESLKEISLQRYPHLIYVIYLLNCK